MAFIVAIDGPAGSGKGTITQLVGKELNLVNIDTGAMYRCVALETLNRNVNIEDTQKIIEISNEINIGFNNKIEGIEVYLNGENVTDKIRSKEVSAIVSNVAVIKEVRLRMVELQRRMAEEQNVIMEGRDIGTYVFPNANVKIYLDASAEERATRRFKQNQEKGIEMTYEEILENIKKRDKTDKERDMGALKQADDAIYLDSTDLTIEQVKEKIIEIIKEKM